MTDKAKFAQLCIDIEHECRDDHIGLWSILWQIRNIDAHVDAASAHDLTLQIVQELLDSGRVVAGQFENRRFCEWNVSPAEIVERIQVEWTRLGKDPDIGDIVWLVAKDGPSPDHE